MDEREELEHELALFRGLRKAAKDTLAETMDTYLGLEDGEPPTQTPEALQEFANRARTQVEMGDGAQRREDHILRRLEYLSMEDLTRASTNASQAVARATWVLAGATVVLALATLALIWATLSGQPG